LNNFKKIVFLTGTRADFGKLKSLIEITNCSKEFDVHIFATGMHLSEKHGYTVDEIIKCGYKNIYKFHNHTSESSMDLTLAKTIEGFSNYIKEVNADLVVIHGDRVEALAGAIAGALNNILVTHIEGGEISGTIDELIRHAVSKLSHIHLVSNITAKKRLVQMGEIENNVFIIGSPDVDVMISKNLPTMVEVKERYEINFEKYAIAMFHPVTTEIKKMEQYANQFTDALIESNLQYIVIHPNNDLGSTSILNSYSKLKSLENFKFFPSLRFEYFLVLLKNSQFIIGNSSAGIREAPYYGLPTVNIGTRQQNRSLNNNIINSSYEKSDILKSISIAKDSTFSKVDLFGTGNSNILFLELLKNSTFWEIDKQKLFKDII
jgi:UDP-N-acetylglucosamine 2-epimerase (hydrolysing)